MAHFPKRMLFWTPRLLSIFFIAFMSIFALDVFDGRHSAWQTVLAFLIHEIPVFFLIGVLILAWRWEWIGTALYAASGLMYVIWLFFIQHHIPPRARLGATLTIAVPAFFIAGLFLANWLKHDELRTPRSITRSVQPKRGQVL